MGVVTAVLRCGVYFQRNGVRATVQRAGQVVRRALFSGRMVILGCEITAQGAASANWPACLKVERKRCEAEISAPDLEAMINFWNPQLARRNIKERFHKGASLWMIKAEGKLAGYGWTLQGRAVEPFYVRLQPEDVQLFDFLVFPEYRGRNINPGLVGCILRSLAAECRGHAYMEVAEWNLPQLSSVKKTPLRRLGSVWMLSLFGYKFPLWARGEGDARGFGPETPFAGVPEWHSRSVPLHATPSKNNSLPTSGRDSRGG